VCHDRIDPVGLALEGFDGVGAARSEDAGQPVDTRATLDNGVEIEGLPGLVDALAHDPDLLPCLGRKVFLWGARRAPSEAEEAALERWIASPGATTSLRGVARYVATSRAMTHVGGEEP
jgi:hypothetical protein